MISLDDIVANPPIVHAGGTTFGISVPCAVSSTSTCRRTPSRWRRAPASARS
jgi:hypothetical protein